MQQIPIFYMSFNIVRQLITSTILVKNNPVGISDPCPA